MVREWGKRFLLTSYGFTVTLDVSTTGTIRFFFFFYRRGQEKVNACLFAHPMQCTTVLLLLRLYWLDGVEWRAFREIDFTEKLFGWIDQLLSFVVNDVFRRFGENVTSRAMWLYWWNSRTWVKKPSWWWSEVNSLLKGVLYFFTHLMIVLLKTIRLF